jgi:uncharacterized RDD family membrane protein YckC
VSDVAPGLLIDSNTGIDVSLPLAGPGVRSYAFLIDWHLRSILAFAWYVTAAIVYNGAPTLSAPLTNKPAWFGAVALPALAIYFLYHPVLEVALRGRTPGKRVAGVRVVSRAGGAASIGALLVRNVFRLIDALPAFYGVGLAVAFISRDNLRWGDMAAGTVLVYQRTQALLPLEAFRRSPGALGAQSAELVFELLERWGTLGPEARVTLARQLLMRHGADAVAVSQAGEHELHSLLEGLSKPA